MPILRMLDMPTKAQQKAGTLYLVHVLTHATRSRLDNELTELGLSAFQYTILNVIENNSGLSSSRLSRRFHVTPQAMGELILSLERRGFIEREEDPENRKILHLNLTAAGRKAVTAGNKIRAALEKELFANYSAEQMQHFREVISGALELMRHGRT